MAEDNQNLRYLLDPYLDWAKGEGVPIYDGFCVDLHTLETSPWARTGTNGAFVHMKGRGDFISVFLYDLSPGAKSIPQQHLFEEVFLVISGHGSAQIETHDGKINAFEWGPNSIFSVPLNSRCQLFNGSGQEPARLAATTDLPVTMNLFHREEFIFNNKTRFPEREGPGTPGWYAGEGEFTPAQRGREMWETNFVPDLNGIELRKWGSRGAGSANLQFCLADGLIHTHCSEMSVGTYKKAHRHSPDFHVFIVAGHGYSLFWYEGEPDFTRIDWAHGSVFAPTDMIFHQHYNTSATPVRYVATAMGSTRYPFTAEKRAIKLGVDVSVKEEGGFQIEYEDQDPRIHRMYLDELAKSGVKCQMGAFMDEKVLLDRMVKAV
jgi:mannose-6-phosphate isomerase-like protein (cupin superfamily)